jgi:hypothetical protein
MLFSLVSSPGFKLGAIVGAVALSMATVSSAEAATFNVTGTLTESKFSTPGPATLSGTVDYDAGVGFTNADIWVNFMNGSSLPNIQFNQIDYQSTNVYGAGFQVLNTPNVGNAFTGYLKFKGITPLSKDNTSTGSAQLSLYGPLNYRGYGYGTATFSPNATAVPTPALLPGLVGFGVTLWRKRRNKTVEVMRS